MKISTRTRWLVTTFAVAAIAVPVAQAQSVFPETGQPNPSGTALLSDPVTLVFPETGQPNPSATAVSPDPVAPVFPVTGQPSPSGGALAPVQAVQAVRPDGFDFRDAGIGAGIASAVALLLAGGMLATRRHRRLAHS